MWQAVFRLPAAGTGCGMAPRRKGISSQSHFSSRGANTNPGPSLWEPAGYRGSSSRSTELRVPFDTMPGLGSSAPCSVTSSGKSGSRPLIKSIVCIQPSRRDHINLHIFATSVPLVTAQDVFLLPNTPLLKDLGAQTC